MRLKGYCKGKRKLEKKPAGVYEIDLGMGMKELKKEIECFTFPAKMEQDDSGPVWKTPVVVGSTVVAAAGAGASFWLMAITPAYGLLFAASLAWLAFVGFANR